ncbi:hypothetical protein CMK11_07440, partial [Candidatus Poribacteria bacterium]|nr:hypothetical protein [Candidatus Poribacteria bacterium]
MMRSARAWTRWAIGVVVYVVLAAGSGMLGERVASVADGGFVAVAVLVAVAWPAPPTGRVGSDLRRLRATITQVALTAPIWAVATGADAVVDTVARVALAASVGAAWAWAASAWPSAGAWMGAGSI